MKISSIIDIVDGSLTNRPSISFVYNIKTNAKRVIEGDLFIAKSQKDLELAVSKGAFAIIYDFDTEILDDEIAWIKVDSTHTALIKLFRFKLSSLDIKAYYCDMFTYEVLSIYKSSNKNLKFISNNLENSVKAIETINEESIIVCSNKELLNKIYPNSLNFSHGQYPVTNLISHSLFETSFSYRDHYFSRLKIPSLYIHQFLDICEFLNHNIEPSKLRKLSFFKPIFLDKFINIIEYGKSDKFIIAQKNLSLVKDEILHLQSKYKYAKTLIVTPQIIEGIDDKQYVLTSLKKLKSFLKEHQFNCLYLVGYDIAKVEKALNRSNHLQTLF